MRQSRKYRKPPRLAEWILNLILRDENWKTPLGDFEEFYHALTEERGRWQARLWYWSQVFGLLPKKLLYFVTWRFVMFRNYVKITLRTIQRQKGYAFINIAGLALGMASCILILLWVQNELSYDRYHENAERIYRVTRLWTDANGVVNLHLGHVAPPIGPLLENDFSQIKQAVRMISVDGIILGWGNRHFEEDRFFFAEEEIFDVFTFDMIQGDPQEALRDPFTIVITDEMAGKYFGTEDAVGKTLSFKRGEQKADFNITGVIRKMPDNSHFHADFLASFRTFEMVVGEEALQSWVVNDYATYLLMEEGYNILRFEDQLDDFIERHYAKGRTLRTRLVLQRLTDIHLHSHLDSEIEANGEMSNVIVFSAIAFFVLLIACINFMNLATARSTNRAREVGMRKVVGAQRIHVIHQFMGESMLMALAALILAVLLVTFMLPWFNQFIMKELSFNLLQNRILLLGLLGIALFVGIVSGSYPAFFLSSFRPVRVLRRMPGTGRSGISFRTVLVVLQFSISIILIASVGIVSRQLRYIRDRRLGFDKEHVVVLPSSPAISGQLEAVKDRLLRRPDIVSVSAAKRVPSDRLLDDAGARVVGGDKEGPIEFRIALLRVDHDYIPTFGMELAAGRNFSKDMPTDSREAFILNETAVRRIGWSSTQEAIEQEFGYGVRRGRIIGVVKDFHFESMHQQIAPIVLLISSHSLNQIAIRIRPDDIPGTLTFLKECWQEYRPDYPFSYYFIDERFDQLYRSEEKLHQIFGVFAFLAIFVACLGLFGLASFTSEKRTKEIGIRKVMGASVPRVVTLLVMTFLKWVLVANIVALPLTWIVMSRWLQNFAYRTGFSLWIYLQSAVLALAVALFTVSYQAVKAAMAKPVESLRYE